MNIFFRIFLGISLISLVSVTSALSAPACSQNPKFAVADFSFALSDLNSRKGRSGIQALKDLGVKTIFRYYDLPNETLACKTLLPEETDLLLQNGFNIAVVYQHNSPSPTSYFKKGLGTASAKRALELAKANGQPAGSAIYFGVDGADQRLDSMAWMYNLAKGEDYVRGAKHYRKVRLGKSGTSKDDKSHREMERLARHYNAFRNYVPKWFKDSEGKSLYPGKVRGHMLLPYIDNYFDEINAEFAKYKDENGNPKYRVGAYSGGNVCKHLLGNSPIPPANLNSSDRKRGVGARVDFCWLGQARGWPGTREFAKTNLWILDQENVTRCSDWKRKSGGLVQLDFNTIQIGVSDFGQWDRVENRDTKEFVRPRKRICHPN